MVTMVTLSPKPYGDDGCPKPETLYPYPVNPQPLNPKPYQVPNFALYIEALSPKPYALSPKP